MPTTDYPLQSGGKVLGREIPPPLPPPVSKLHDDVLHHIFSLNSHARIYHDVDSQGTFTSLRENPEEAGLIANRYTSQVCHRWRSIIISSPSIWANSLDLQLLNQEEDHWRNEVVKRTGQALLTVVGTLKGRGYGSWNEVYGTRYSTPFALALLGGQWNRVRSLTIYSEGTGTMLDTICGMLQRPAPNLEHCVFVYDYGESGFTGPPTLVESTLFRDNSPRLRSFFCEGVRYQLSGTWLSNIRRLLLMLHEHTFTVVDLLRVLQSMPFLEALHIESDLEDTGPDEADSDLPPIVSLPRLANLAIIGGVQTVTELLENITPASGCNLLVNSREIDEPTELNLDLLRITRAHSTFFRNISNLRDVKSVFMAVKTNFRLFIGPDGSPLSTNNCLDLNYHISSEEPDWHSGISSAILEALSSCHFSRVTRLALELDDDIPDPFDKYLHAFFGALPAVEELTCNSGTFQYLLDVQTKSQAMLLPQLLTIVLTDLRPWTRLVRFLVRRLMGGAPIATLRLPPHHADDRRRLCYLDGIDGLSVIWNQVLKQTPKGQTVYIDGREPSTLEPPVRRCVLDIAALFGREERPPTPEPCYPRY